VGVHVGKVGVMDPQFKTENTPGLGFRTGGTRGSLTDTAGEPNWGKGLKFVDGGKKPSSVITITRVICGFCACWLVRTGRLWGGGRKRGRGT